MTEREAERWDVLKMLTDELELVEAHNLLFGSVQLREIVKSIEQGKHVKPSTMLTEQPKPTVATGDVWAEILDETTDKRLRALYTERREQGIARYGVPLQRDNGRDHSADAVQELVDAIVYFRAAGRKKAQSLVEAVLIFVLDEHDKAHHDL